MNRYQTLRRFSSKTEKQASFRLQVLMMNGELDCKEQSPDIIFPLTDFEDFYLQNQPSPTFTDDGQSHFDYPHPLEISNSFQFTKLIICNFVGALSIPENIVQLVNLFKNEEENDDDDDDYIDDAEISQII